MIIATKAAAASATAAPQVMITTLSTNVLYSTNGTSYLTSAATNSGRLSIGAARFDGRWLIGCDSGALQHTDDTFSAWTSVTPASATGVKRYFTVSSNTALVVGYWNTGTNDNYTTEYSTAIATWTAQRGGLSTTAGLQLTGAANNGSGTWAVCGDGASASNYYSSTNLTGSYTSRTIGFASARGTAFGASIWVVVGDSGNLRSSTDLVTWTSRTSQFSTSNIRAVTFANSLFVAVGQSGKISTSTNGTTWTARTSGKTTTLEDVKYSSALGLWIACGDTGTIITSPDAITWTDRSTGSASLTKIAVAS